MDNSVVVITSAPKYQLRMPVQAIYEPKEDITAYELALILPMFHGKPVYEEDWEGSWTRHFRRTDQAQSTDETEART